jgi:hypothetical protein
MEIRGPNQEPRLAVTQYNRPSKRAGEEKRLSKIKRFLIFYS